MEDLWNINGGFMMDSWKVYGGFMKDLWTSFRILMFEFRMPPKTIENQ